MSDYRELGSLELKRFTVFEYVGRRRGPDGRFEICAEAIDVSTDGIEALFAILEDTAPEAANLKIAEKPRSASADLRRCRSIHSYLSRLRLTLSVSGSARVEGSFALRGMRQSLMIAARNCS